MRACEPDQSCALRLTSFSGQDWRFDPSNPQRPCALWLDRQGAWLDRAPESAILELWLGATPGKPCPALRERGKVPRWMLLSQPVESAQVGGMGTRRPRFTLSRQPSAVKDALIQGQVDGVLALGHGETELLRDLETATIRSGRQWLDRAVFSLIFGRNPALGPPESGLAARSHRPELWTQKEGLEIEVRGLLAADQEISLQVHARRKSASFALPRIAPRHDPLRTRAHVEPCLDCGPRRQDPLQLAQ